MRITGCCWQFICSHDLAKIESQQCPILPKNFTAHKISLSNENISCRFIDNDGIEHEINKFIDYQALKRCTTIANMISDANGIADFRGTHPWVTQKNIELLIKYIQDPKTIDLSGSIANAEMLKLGRFFRSTGKYSF